MTPVSGRAGRAGRAVWTDRELRDPVFPHADGRTSPVYVPRVPLPAYRGLAGGRYSARVSLIPAGEPLEAWATHSDPEWVVVSTFSRPLADVRVYAVQRATLLAACDYDGEIDAVEYEESP